MADAFPQRPATATAPIPANVQVRDIGPRVLVMGRDDSTEQRKLKGTADETIREFTITYSTRTTVAERNMLRDHYRGQGVGEAYTFNYIYTEDGKTYTVRYAESTFQSNLVGYNLYGPITVVLREVEPADDPP